MNRPIFILLLLLTTPAVVSTAQVQTPVDDPYLYAGIGTGLDYGGIGAKFEYQPIKWLGISAGAGFNWQSYGLNAGLSFYPLPDKKLQPMATLLYGYNASIIIIGLPEFSKTYYGFSPGVGGLLKTGKRGNKLYLALFHPFRSRAFRDDFEALKVNPAVNIDSEILPVTISIGFNWAL